MILDKKLIGEIARSLINNGTVFISTFKDPKTGEKKSGIKMLINTLKDKRNISIIKEILNSEYITSQPLENINYQDLTYKEEYFAALLIMFLNKPFDQRKSIYFYNFHRREIIDFLKILRLLDYNSEKTKIRIPEHMFYEMIIENGLVISENRIKDILKEFDRFFIINVSYEIKSYIIENPNFINLLKVLLDPEYDRFFQPKFLMFERKNILDTLLELSKNDEKMLKSFLNNCPSFQEETIYLYEKFLKKFRVERVNINYIMGEIEVHGKSFTSIVEEKFFDWEYGFIVGILLNHMFDKDIKYQSDLTRHLNWILSGGVFDINFEVYEIAIVKLFTFVCGYLETRSIFTEYFRKIFINHAKNFNRKTILNILLKYFPAERIRNFSKDILTDKDYLELELRK